MIILLDVNQVYVKHRVYYSLRLPSYLRSYEGMMVIRTKVSIFYHVPSYIRTNEGNNTVIINII